ncbi:hypothetical protein C0Q70_08296 [Pomacea canaliculata]|uniref:Uncharacterized protein n=1 Tax=Pomacea canaliculata TaxID=400727 RepID=A0A2T7PHF3_POMCA|nr:hypothetical protein C0Q70_08296 [Pomacea canaliculata]
MILHSTLQGVKFGFIRCKCENIEPKHDHSSEVDEARPTTGIVFTYEDNFIMQPDDTAVQQQQQTLASSLKNARTIPPAEHIHLIPCVSSHGAASEKCHRLIPFETLPDESIAGLARNKEDVDSSIHLPLDISHHPIRHHAK